MMLARQIGVAGGDRLDQFGVLGPGALAARLRDREVVPAPPAFDESNVPGQHGVSRDGVDVCMQGRVGRDEPFRVVGGQCVQPVLLQLPQPVDVLGGGVLGGEPGRVRLQDRADAEKLVHLVLGGGVHERALRGAQVDPAVGLQPLQGFTHRLPADAEVLGQFVFDQVLAPLQGALHDQVHDRVVDGLAQGRGTLHPARGSVGQRVMLRSLAALTWTRGGK